MFKTNGNRGFCLTFNNGWEISVQFGLGSYSSNRSVDPDKITSEFRDKPDQESKTAEIAVFDADKDWALPGEVVGYLNVDQVAKVIAELTNPEPDMAKIMESIHA